MKYLVKVEGQTFEAEFSYYGFKQCQAFIEKHGKQNKAYKIKVVK